jgi:glycosyltransferase involved in cell wall biosynthesis
MTTTIEVPTKILDFITSGIPKDGTLLIWGSNKEEYECLLEKLPNKIIWNIDTDNIYSQSGKYDAIYINCANPLSVSLRALHLLKDSRSKIFLKYDKEFNLSLFDIFDFSFHKEGESKIAKGSPKFNIGKRELGSSKLFDDRIKLTLALENLGVSEEDLSKEESERIGISTQEDPKPKEVNKNTILWVMNVCWRGGTALYVLDAIKSMRSAWHHKVIYVNQGENQSMYQEFLANNIDISHCPNITKDLLEEVSPVAVMLSNTDPNRIEGKHPWGWLTDNYLTIYIHHSAVGTWLPNTESEIFVSSFLLDQYMNLKDRLRRPIIIPPGIRTTSYAYIERRLKTNKPTLNIGYLASDNPQKYPKEILDIVYAAVEESGIKNVNFTVVGGEKHLKDPGGLNYNLKLLPGVENVINQYRDFDIFLYKSKVQDTWGRNVTEAMAAGLPVVTYKGGAMAEQINHEANGFICENDEDYVKYLSQLLSDKELRFDIGSLGRMKAIVNFDIRKFAEYVEPIIMRNSWK